MKRYFSNTNIKKITLIVLILTLTLNGFITYVSTEPATTQVSVEPSDQTVSQEPFAINITIKDVVDLNGWQIKLYYYPSILDFITASYPTGHVFEGKQFIEFSAAEPVHQTFSLENKTQVDLANPLNTKWKWVEDSPLVRRNLKEWSDKDNSGTLSTLDLIWLEPAPLYPDAVEKVSQYYLVTEVKSEGSKITLVVEISYVAFGATLYPGEQTFSGSGILCQLDFTGIGPGISILNFSRPLGGDTSLLDSNLDSISFEVNDGSVTVLEREYPRDPSQISITVYPSTVEIDSNVTISGTIDPIRDGVTVTIFYGLVGEALARLVTIKTNASSNYHYTWTTDKVGEFELYASWFGDANYKGAESNTTTVIVNKKTSTISLNIHPTNVTAGSSVIINGTVTPKPAPPFQPGEDITIFSFRVGATWTKLATVYLDENGIYKYVWKPDESGLYEIKASWSGDETTSSADSKVKTIEVTGEAPPPEAPSDIMVYLPYIAATLVIIAIAIGVIYFTKIRKS